MKRYVTRLMGRLDEVARRYPLMLLVSLGSAVTCVIASERHASELRTELLTYQLQYLCMTLVLGHSLMFALNMWEHRTGRPWWMRASGLVILGLFYFLFFPAGEMTVVHGVSYSLILVLVHLLASLLPFIGGGWAHYWDYNVRLFIRVCAAALYTCIVLAGVGLILGSIDILLFQLPNRSITHTMTFVSIFGSTIIFLLLNRDGWSDLCRPLTYPSALRFLVTYVITPVLIVFGLVLVLYVFKLIFERQWPDEMVCGFAMAYGILGLLTWLLSRPLYSDEKSDHVDVFGRYFFISVIPLMGAYFIGLQRSMDADKFDEFYITAYAAGALLTLLAVAYIIRRSGPVHWVAASLAVTILLLLITPYLNMFDVVARYHSDRVESLLVSQDLLDEQGKIDYSQPILPDTKKQIIRGLRYVLIRQPDVPISYLSDSMQHAYTDSLQIYPNYGHFDLGFAHILPQPGKSVPPSKPESMFTIRRRSAEKYRAVLVSEVDYIIPEINHPDHWTIDDLHISLRRIFADTDSSHVQPTLLLSEQGRHIDELMLNAEIRRALHELLDLHDGRSYIQIEEPIIVTGILGRYAVELQIDAIRQVYQDSLRIDNGRILIKRR